MSPDGTSFTSEFYPNGLLKRTYGSRVYPVAYGYDNQGRMTFMTNWSQFTPSGPGSGMRVTAWNYDEYRGWLTSKRYPNPNDGLPSTVGPDYEYYGTGKLKARKWVRGSTRLTTTYLYNIAGELSSVDYSDTTPDVAYGYNRLGRQTTVTQGTAPDVVNLVSRFYSDDGQLLSEAWTQGTLAGLTVTNEVDALMRRVSVTVRNGSTVLSRVTNSFDQAGRLATVGNGTVSATYSYVVNSPMVGQIAFKQGSTPRMTTTRAFDNLNRLQSISSAPSADAAVSFNYTYNSANQRTRRDESDTFWRYEYDTLGQVRSGKKYWSDGTPVAGQQFEYAFDEIGNRTQTKAGGDEVGENFRTSLYSANLLNQYSSRTVPGSVDVFGVALATNTVTVDGQAPYRKGEYFRKELSVGNTSVPVWKSATVTAPGETSVTRSEFVPQTPESFTYDLDGNLLADGRWSYTWDAENRLVAMAARTTVGPLVSLKFDYDAQGRRIRKQVWGNATWSGSATNDLRFVYDGWNLLATLNSGLGLLTSFTWGSDLSGSLQGAGGVGGLLAVTYFGPQATNAFPAFDGNGNVMALVNAADGKTVANYEYGPFGEVIRATGPMAKANPIRWSTQYTDDEADLVCYLHRYYNPSTGRWLSRDPIDDVAFIASCLENKQVETLKVILSASDEANRWIASNPVYAPKIKSLMKGNKWSRPKRQTGLSYCFTENDPVGSVDKLGLDRWHGDALHTWIIVENWNEDCSAVTGYTRIEFSPCVTCWQTYLTLFLWAPGEVTITAASGPPSGLNVWKQPSSCKADKFLLEWAYEYQKNPDRYNFIGQNCRHFSAYAQNVGIEETAE